MGIPRGTARLLLEEHRHRPFRGSVVQLGRSTVYFTWRELKRWAARHGVELSPTEVELSHDPRLARQGCIDDRTFLRALGFDEVRSCDISEWEGADYVHDLNLPLPDELSGRFDAVLDPGSSLQIFHQPQLLANLHALLKDGGRVIHAAVPSNNHMDLGFYMFSPTFFHDFYSQNGWELDCEYVCQVAPYWHRGRFHSAPWKVYRYEPGSLDHLNYGRYGGRQTVLFTIARKVPGATADTIPQLGLYVRSWQVYDERRDEDGLAAGELPDEAPTLGGRLEAFLERHPLLDRAYLPVKRVREKLRRLGPQKMPPLVGRY